MKKYCEICGTKFYAKPSHVKVGFGRFCSRKCSDSHRREVLKGKGNPNWRGGKSIDVWQNMDPQERKARIIFRNTFYKNGGEKEPCVICGTINKVEAHHIDYDFPLEVVWFCHKHHMEHHKLLRNKIKKYLDLQKSA
ncbi:MAG: hypothetical protein ACERKJ_10625 [Candidatus Dadabacteria bacterium]